MVLVPAFGVVGAAVAVVLSQFAAFIMFNYFVDKELFYLQFCVVKRNANA